MCVAQCRCRVAVVMRGYQYVDIGGVGLGVGVGCDTGGQGRQPSTTKTLLVWMVQRIQSIDGDLSKCMCTSCDTRM